MLSRLLRRFAITTTLIFSFNLLTSCSYFFDEKKQATEVSYNEKSGSCISEVNKTLAIYFDSENLLEVEDSEIDNFVKCYQDSLASFIKHTKSGRVESENYTAENIELLISKLHPQISVGVERLQIYIYLKQFLIGGEAETVSKKELQIIYDMLPQFANILKDANPYRGVLFQVAELSRDKKNYKLYNQLFKSLSYSIGKFLRQFESYKGERILNLRQAGQFILSEFYGADVEDKLKYLDLLVAFKNLALNQSGEDLQAKDLSFFAIQTVQTYRALLQFKYFIQDDNIFLNLGSLASFVTRVPGQLKDSSVFKTVTSNSLVDVFDLGEKILSASAKSRPKNRIAFSKIRELFHQLELSGYMDGSTVSAETMSLFVEKFSMRWLDPGSEMKSSITLEKLSYLRRLVMKWFDRQNLVNKLFAKSDKEKISLTSIPKKLKDNPTLVDWKKLLNKVSVHQWDDKNRVVFNGRRNLKSFSYEELTVSNSISLLVEIFMRPFNLSELNPQNHKVTADQAQLVYEVLRILGVEMAFMDSRVFDTGLKAFTEANSFTTQTNNDDDLDYFEGYEYLSIAMSSGQVADRIYKETEESSRLDYKDVLRSNVIDAAYFREYLNNNFAQFFSSLDTVSRYWESADDLQKEKFIGTLEIASRSGVTSEKPFDMGEIRVLSTVLYYLESIFHVFDQDKNGMAEGEELLAAKEHFMPLLKQFILKTQKKLFAEKGDILRGFMERKKALDEEVAEWLAPKVFIYLLEHGDIPKEANTALLALLTKEGEELKFAEVRADARSVLRVFSALSKVSHQSHVTQIRDFLFSEHGHVGVSDFLPLFNRSQEVPNCTENSQQKFCLWARLLYCNETMNEELFHWMSDNYHNLFPIEDWKGHPEYSLHKAFDDIHPTARRVKKLPTIADVRDEVNTTVFATMKQFEFTFRRHKTFSTLCAFPQLSADKEPAFEAVGEDETSPLEDENLTWFQRQKKRLSESFHGTSEDEGYVESPEKLKEDAKGFVNNGKTLLNSAWEYAFGDDEKKDSEEKKPEKPKAVSTRDIFKAQMEKLMGKDSSKKENDEDVQSDEDSSEEVAVDEQESAADEVQEDVPEAEEEASDDETVESTKSEEDEDLEEEKEESATKRAAGQFMDWVNSFRK